MSRFVHAVARLLPLIGVLLLLGAGPSLAQELEVRMVPLARDPLQYVPSSFTVRAGTTVRFVNDDSDIHTATARNGSFDSGLMFQGQTWQYVLTTPGTYDFFCLPHPWMVGTVIVE